ncbi:MAG: phosphoglycerate mutase (2,3-diphosphoglycerate-independent) [Christensenellaceae bacterium]|jgi:2,3-bisphosphoglycerate-independent phosphoglycerate mutase|nr:phosphoglycerate mutase (2,3-diphosphoglycerate-independent) [Christensenellaceae bacterium]
MTKTTTLRGASALARAVKEAYAQGSADYSLEPMSLEGSDGKPVGSIAPGDAVIFCCRRGEREIELTDAFTDPSFTGFERKKLDPLDFVILTMYSDKYTDIPIAFAPSKVAGTLAQVLAEAGKSQFHCAESEKFAHVTFFFNGGNQQPFAQEEDLRIPSPKGVPFDTVPALSLPQVADKVVEGLDKGYDFIVTNFANGDVIGHTSNDAAKVACAGIVDTHLGRVIEEAKQKGYAVFVTADHGNIEVLHTPEGTPHVAHTSNLVAFAAVAQGAAPIANEGKLGDVAPTVLAAMGIAQPAEMLGAPLFRFEERQKVLLIILDGWGLGAQDAGNPIYTGVTPNWDALLATAPWVKLAASGEAVGLAAGKAGNSEAGHINLGSGRVVLQDDVRLDAAMKDGSFAENPVFLASIRGAKERGAALHLLALLTKKSSHGSIDYPLALLDMAKANGLNDVFVHIIFDGRSTEPGSAPALLEELGETLDEKGIGYIVSGVGRGIALDRDQNWAKVQRAYESLVAGAGTRYRE